MSSLIVFALLLPAAIVAAAVYLLVRVTTLSREVRDLRNRLDALAHPLETRETTSSPVRPVRSERELPNAAFSSGLERISEPDVQSEKTPPVSVGSKRSRTREEWEVFVGGKLLNIIGAAALIIGVGFFLKYAFDKNWIPEIVRVLIGATIGGGSLWAARKTFLRGFEVFSQGLIGAGIAILYLSVYASFNFYFLVPQWFAFVLMSLVTVVALVQGALYRSVAVGMLGWAGGYLTPVMLSTGDVNAVGLLTYVALLTVALLALVLTQRSWGVVHVLTLAGTWGTYVAWHVGDYDESLFALALFFVLAYWSLMTGVDVWLRLQGAPYTPAHRVMTVVNAIVAVFFVYLIIQPRSETWLGILYVLLASAYAAASVATAVRTPDAWFMRLTSLLAVLLGALGISQWSSGFESIITLSAYGTLVVFLGRTLDLSHLALTMRWFYVSLLVLILTIRHALGFTDDILLYDPVLNERFAAFAVLTLCSAVSAWLYRNVAADRSHAFFLSVSILSFVVLATVETNDAMRLARSGLTGAELAHRVYQSVLMIVFLWFLLGYAFVWAGHRFGSSPARVSGIILLSCAAVIAVGRGFLYTPAEFYVPLLNLRAGVLVIGSALLLGANRIAIQDGRSLGDTKLGTACAIAAATLVFTFLTGEVIDVFGLEKLSLDPTVLTPEEWEQASDRIDNLRQLSLSGVWLLYSVAMMVAGFIRSSRGLRAASIVLFGLTILKIFLYDLSFLETVYRMVSFVGLGVILLAVSYAYQRFKAVLFPPGNPHA